MRRTRIDALRVGRVDMFGHRTTLRAFPSISYRFLEQCSLLTGYGG
jgi:hypothetical protein